MMVVESYTGSNPVLSYSTPRGVEHFAFPCDRKTVHLFFIHSHVLLGLVVFGYSSNSLNT